MKGFFSLLSKISAFAAAVAALALVGQISYLVVMQYRSQVALNRSAMREATADVEKRSTAVAYFYSERVDDLRDIADSRELSAYFENRALGMSMKYGLGASLLNVRRLLDRVVTTKKLGDRKMYERIVFADDKGRVLIDSGTGKSCTTPENWKAVLKASGSVSATLCGKSGSDECVIIALPYLFNGKQKGQVIAWISSSLMYSHFIAETSGNTRHPIALLFNGKYLYRPELIPSDSSLLPAEIKFRKPFQLAFADGTPATAVTIPVENTPFSLMTVLSAAEFDLRPPRYLLFSTGGAALFILIGLFFFMRLTLRNAVLRAHLEESGIRERTVEEKNNQLQREFAERQKAEEEVRRLNSELEERVRTRTVELESANKELEAFCHSVSHDLRAPLTRLEGFVQALLEDHSEQLDKEGKYFADRINSATMQLKEMIDGLLDLTRLTRDDLCFETVELSNIAQNVAQELKQTEPNRKVDFHIAPQVIGRGDHRLLRVVMENLLGNAWKFTGNKGVATIEFGVNGSGVAPAYFVRDNGTGFDMKYAGKLFKPFHRIHGPLEFDGTGIGLASAHRIIERHGGRMWAEGEVGKGAVFYFTLA